MCLVLLCREEKKPKDDNRRRQAARGGGGRRKAEGSSIEEIRALRIEKVCMQEAFTPIAGDV